MAVEGELYDGDFLRFDNAQEQLRMLTWQQQECGAYSPPSGADVATTMGFPHSLTSLLEKQKQDLDWALHIQNERLKSTLQESSTQQLSFLLHKYEPYITALLSQKDEIISSASKKKSILENHLRNIETEIATWRVKAREGEARVAELNNALIQLREKNNGGDEESRCDPGSATCLVCKARRSCVVFMPCGHLCSCEFCGDFVGVCPVCASVKEFSVEVLLE